MTPAEARVRGVSLAWLRLTAVNCGLSPVPTPASVAKAAALAASRTDLPNAVVVSAAMAVRSESTGWNAAELDPSNRSASRPEPAPSTVSKDARMAAAVPDTDAGEKNAELFPSSRSASSPDPAPSTVRSRARTAAASRSSAEGAMKTTALPLRLMAASLLVDLRTVRVSVALAEVYVP